MIHSLMTSFRKAA